MFIFKFIYVIALCISTASCYFTLPGKCPENVKVKSDFKLSEFYDTWYQAYHYSSDGQITNNCSTIKIFDRATGIYLNQSRVDLGLFHRFSIGKLEIPRPKNPEEHPTFDVKTYQRASALVEAEASRNLANLNVAFHFEDAPRRLMNRTYPFRILATNYNFYATVYTCSYSPLTDKHFIYVWILSRSPILNDVSKELALKPLEQLGIDSSKIVKDDKSKCTPKYYDDKEQEPTTFRYPVIM